MDQTGYMSGSELHPVFEEGQELAVLVQCLTDYAIYQLDIRGYVRSWNPGGARIKGYLEHEIVGEHFSIFYTPEDIDRCLPQVALTTAAREGRFEADGWRVRKDGSRFWASVLVEPIMRGSALLGFVKVTRDITDRYEAQERLQVMQRALVQAQKVEAVGRLTLGLAHDFNNLLTIIVNSLDLIAMRASDDQRVSELILAASRAADQGSLLTRQLLSFARGQDLVAESLEVNSVLKDLMTLFTRACGPGIALELDLIEEKLEVEADKGQLEAALLNLVTNSRDALSDKKISEAKIVVRASPELTLPPHAAHGPKAKYVCIAVSDTGAGMSHNVMEQASEPFYTTKEVGKGSGLGLSQVFGFATQSGGFASISSEIGVGTTVSVWLPLRGRANAS